MNNVGHDSLSMHPIFTLTAAFLIMSSVMILDFCLLMSIPTSFIAYMAIGLISPAGLVPALMDR
jgi:hypothetical protein